jgi:hypothetical protein
MYRKNVANQYIYFALVNTSTGLGLTGASVTAYLALDNGAQATATGTTSELGNGHYRFNLSQADTNADEGSYLFIASGASPVEKTVVFTAANPSDGAAFGLSRIDATIGSRATQTSVDATPTSVWNSLTTTTWVADSFGKHILISNNNNRSVQVTGAGSGHVAADIHALQAGVITSAAFSANWLTAAGLASDAVTEVVNGVWNEPTSGHTTAGTTGKALIDSGAAGNPWSTDLATGYSGTQAGNILNNVNSQTDLIQAGGTVNVTTPVTATGQLASPLIIGDDYLNANGRAFSWTVALPSGFVAATATCKFGMRYEDDQGVNSFVQSGTVIDAGSGNVTLRFDVGKAVTGLLRPGWYDWSVEIASASGTEITRVKSGKNAEWQEKQT